MRKNFFLIIFVIIAVNLFAKNMVIGDIRFVGNSFFKEKELRALMTTKKGDIFDKDIFKSDMKKIVSVYKENGFFNMKIINKEQKLDIKNNNMVIYIYIQEGPRNRIGTIRFRGNVYVHSDTLYNIAGIKEGDYYEEIKTEKVVNNIINYYKNNGFPYIFVQDTILTMDSTVMVLFDIQEGPRVVWGNTIIRGLKRYRKKDMINYIAIKKGEIYKSADMDITRMRLYKSGLVASSSMSLELSNDSTEVDLIVNIREKKSKNIVFKLGYQWVLSGYIGIDYEDNYFINGNRKLRLSGYTSGGKDDEMITKLEGGLVFPFIFVSDYSFLIKGKHKQDKGDTIWYVSNDLGGYLSKEKESFIPTFFIYGQKEYYQKLDTTDMYFSIYLGHSVFWNNTDNKFSPHNGIRYLIDLKSGYVINRNFLFEKLYSEIYSYKTFFNRIMYVAVIRGGYIFPEPIFELSPDMLFSMGGDGSLRGYDKESIGDDYNGYIRGTKSLKYGMEIRVRIWKDLYLGALYEKGYNGFGWLSNGVYAYGGGLRYDTIIGFVRIDWIKNMYNDNSFYLGIGDGL